MGLGDRIPNSRCTFLKISFTQLHRDAYNLWRDNFEETGLLEKGCFDVDIDKYLGLEREGFLIVIAVMYELIIIGYAVIIADTLLHSKSIHYAKIDTVFIGKPYRSLILFKRLLQYIENYLKPYGVKHLFIGSSMKRPLDKILKKYNYRPIETLFCKELI